MYEKGRGRMTMRARMVTESLRGGQKQLVVTELPYSVSKSRIIARIAGLSRKGLIPEVSDLRDESDREGIRLVVELKRGSDAGRVMELLFRKTPLQSTFGAIMLALDGGKQPGEFTLKELLARYRDHRLEVIRRRSRFDLEKAEAELHITLGLLLALDRIDDVIAVIRRSADRAEASARLQDRFGLSAVQADAILRMRLARLTALEGDQLREQEVSLRAAIRELRALLGDQARQLETMLAELDEVVEQFADERRTVILPGKNTADFGYVKTEAADEDVVVTLSRHGYLKRIPMHLYRRRVTTGTPLAAMDRFPGDYLERVIVARTRGWLLCFTDRGHLHFLRVEDIPEGALSSRGRSVWNLLGTDRRDTSVAIRSVDDLGEARFVTFVTRLGQVKRTRLGEFSTAKAGGLIAARLRDGDSMLDVVLTGGDDEILLVTSGGRGIRFEEGQIPVVGRVAQGVKGVELRDGDEVVGIVAVKRQGSVLVVTESGTAARMAVSDFPLRKRGGLGVAAISFGSDGERLAGAIEALDDDNVMLVSATGALLGIPVGNDQVAAAQFARAERRRPRSRGPNRERYAHARRGGRAGCGQSIRSVDMRFLVLGGGAQGTAAAFDLLQDEAVAEVVIADITTGEPHRCLEPHVGGRLKLVEVDATDSSRVAALMEGTTAVLCALPYYFNLPMAQLAVDTGVHYADLGGNTAIVCRQLDLHEFARAKRISVVPDTGLAREWCTSSPRRASTRWTPSTRSASGWRSAANPETASQLRDRLLARGGAGLLRHPGDDPARRQADHRRRALGNSKRWSSPSRSAASKPSSRAAALDPARTLRGLIDTLEYKTLRYPGHARIMRAIRELGLLGDEDVDYNGTRVNPRRFFIERATPLLSGDGGGDMVVARVEVTGTRDGEGAGIRYEILDRYDPATGLSAMARTTGFSLSITALLQARCEVPIGVGTPDEYIPPARYIAELARRGIRTNVTESPG